MKQFSKDQKEELVFQLQELLREALDDVLDEAGRDARRAGEWALKNSLLEKQVAKLEKEVAELRAKANAYDALTEDERRDSRKAAAARALQPDYPDYGFESLGVVRRSGRNGE